VEEKRHEYEVVVVGAGTAGIPCALAAASAGARVLLVDKDHQVGGTLHLSSGHMSAAGTRLQRSKGIVDDPDTHLADIVRLSGGTAREDIVRRAVGLAAGTVDWLDSLGFPFAPESPEIPEGHEPYSVARTYHGVAGGLSILEVLSPLLDRAVASGAVVLRTATPVTALLTTDDGGGVRGVTVWGRDGDEDLEAGAVVLATGGFASNPELFTEIEGVKLMSVARGSSTGDGLVMARDIGAGIGGRGTYLPTFGGIPHPGQAHRSLMQPRPRVLLSERDPWEIYVDRSGNRFVAEDAPGSDAKERALLAVPDMTFWMVFDEAARERSAPMVAGWAQSDIAELAGRRPGVHVADSVAELAAKAGIAPDGLARTLAEYNAATELGEPDSWGRTVRPAPLERPPFYAIENHGISLITFAGLDVGDDLAVRRTDGSLIPGLFAVGEVIGNGATAGNAFCSGMAVTPSLSLGRWLGAELASRLLMGRQEP
jgi:fumarate reductase flavoprotein subunit